ncbi:MAG: phosphate/phosphite/phosphonate ABC transporter substrate-binding protein [Burkholderiales bacterium]|nr:phosphate/phosphite/phosphonate ABC transporter substrate-binding protein [Burkholderiales bacterium]
MDRRRFAGSVLAMAAAGRTRVAGATEPTLRFGITAVFLYDRLRMLARWQAYLEAATGARVQFVQRGVYSPIIDGLRAGNIDFAWICGFPYVLHAREFRLLAVPVWRERPLYQSYLIAGVGSSVTGLSGLRGRSFAFSDPLSNSGYLYVRYLLARQQLHSDDFFGRSFFAHSHPNVVEAVAEGLADAGAVDGYVWEVLAEVMPALTARTRIVQRSPEFGFPPLVAAAHVDVPTRERMRRALLTMHESADGRAILQELRLDRLDIASPRLFDSIAEMAHVAA